MAREFLVATFARPDDVIDAVTAIRAHGFKIYDVYAPYPLHGLDHAMGLRRSRLGYVTALSGLLGLCVAIGFEFYTAVFDWSLNVGGKPDNSTLAFVPIGFEITVLAAGLATAGAFLVRSRLFPGARARLAGPRVTDDRFAIALRWRTSAFDTGAARSLLLECGAIAVTQSEVDL